LEYHGLSWTGYRKARTGVKKQIARHMQELHLLSDPAGFKFRIIFLRKILLTYYQDELKQLAFRKVVESFYGGLFG